VADAGVRKLTPAYEFSEKTIMVERFSFGGKVYRKVSTENCALQQG
jgi:hypothetical protein